MNSRRLLLQRQALTEAVKNDTSARQFGRLRAGGRSINASRTLCVRRHYRLTDGLTCASVHFMQEIFSPCHQKHRHGVAEAYAVTRYRCRLQMATASAVA